MQMQSTRRYPEHPPQVRNYERLAKGLGWFSIGLGLAEILAPERMAHMIGMRDGATKRGLLRFYGFREVAAGIGILSGTQQASWLWGRVAGDVLDIATLGSAMASKNTRRSQAAIATAAVLGVTALDVYCGQKLTFSKPTHVRMVKTIIVNCPPEEVYAFWYNFENLPNIVLQLMSVQKTSDRLSHWRAKSPTGRIVDWDAETITDQPNSIIAWRSLKGSDVENSGSVRFERATGGRGTLVRVELEYMPPGGKIGANIAKLFGGEPGQQVESALRRMKQILETGGIVRSDADIHFGMHPAQPPAHTAETYHLSMPPPERERKKPGSGPTSGRRPTSGARETAKPMH